MKCLLRMDPSQRMNADEALMHPYFEGLKERDSSLPHKLNNKVQEDNKNSSTSNVSYQ